MNGGSTVPDGSRTRNQFRGSRWFPVTSMSGSSPIGGNHIQNHLHQNHHLVERPTFPVEPRMWGTDARTVMTVLKDEKYGAGDRLEKRRDQKRKVSP